MIPYSRQQVDEDDIEAVVQVLRSDYLTQGPVLKSFEDSVAKYCGADYAVASVNASAALHLACLSLGVGSEDVVWTSAVSFVASANCARYCGANVDFVDVDPDDGLMSVPLLREKLAEAEKNGTLPKALIVVHLGGQSCAMKEIFLLCSHYGVKIIEDASHALGAVYLDEPVGSCRYSDIAVFSFHPVKPITSGEGGMITTNDPSLALSAQRYGAHGIVRDKAYFLESNDLEASDVEASVVELSNNAWYYEQQYLGYNYRLSDIHAALGLSQLKKIDKRTSERAKLAALYHQKLSDLPIKCLTQSLESVSSWHLFIIQVDSFVRNRLFDMLRDNGYGVNLHYIPITSQPYYQALGFQPEDYPGAQAYSASAISLPLYSGMDIEVIDCVVALISEFFSS